VFDHVFVDMDGVLCDMIGAVLKLHDRSDMYKSVEYHFERTLDMSVANAWAPVIASGPKFWENLEMFPWALELIDFANKISREVTILTRPLILEHSDGRETGYCVQGKLAWLRKNLNWNRDVIFTAKKNAVSKPGALLIDDDELYEEQFRAAGGHQIIWPSFHNKFKDKQFSPMNEAYRQYALALREIRHKKWGTT